jgi:hypothetical protein
VGTSSTSFMRRWPVAKPTVCVVAALITLAALASCRKAPAPVPTQQGTEARAASSLAIAGQLMDGADQAAIRAYLQTVKELKPKRFSVQWSPDTVAVSRDAAMRSLHGISQDGSRYTFDSSDPIVQQLQPGRILWIWDIALRRIDQVVRIDDEIVIHTRPVSLTEALPQSDIEFEAPVDFANAFSGLRPHLPKRPPSAAGIARRPRFYYVGLQPANPAASPTTPDASPPDEPGPPDEDDDDYGLVGPSQDGADGVLLGFEYSLGYHVLPGHVSFELQARKEEEGSAKGATNEMHRDQRDEYFEYANERREAVHEERVAFARIVDLDQQLKAADQRAVSAAAAHPDIKSVVAHMQEEREKAVDEYKKWQQEAADDEAKMQSMAKAGKLARQVFYIISDNVDIRFRSKMDLDSANFGGAIQTASGALQHFATHFSNMNGRIDLELVARLGQPGNGAVSAPVLNIPVVMNVPVPIDGIPLMVQFAADFMLKLFISGNHAAHHWVGHFRLGNGVSIDADPTHSGGEGNMAAPEPPEVEDDTAESPGTSGDVLAVQLPRFGLGIGLLGTSALGYMDLVTVLTIVNSASTAALNPQCRRMTLDRIGSVGIEVSVVPIPVPLVNSGLNRALSQRKEVWRAPQWKVVEPNVPICQLGGDR